MWLWYTEPHGPVDLIVIDDAAYVLVSWTSFSLIGFFSLKTK